jgi:hypothetical protein
LEESERGEGEHNKETRKGMRRRGREDIKDRVMKGTSFISTKRRLERELGDATPTSRCCVTLYGMVKLVRNDDEAF